MTAAGERFFRLGLNAIEQIRETGRAAAGVKLINLDEGETLVSLERVAEDESELSDASVISNVTEPEAEN